MKASNPHYLLFSETGRKEEPGKWRFVLRAAGSLEQFEACDDEPDVRGERLELLTVVRALESLDRPSHVTLMTPDPYVRQGIRFGLPEWRNNNWQWEFFGQMVPVKHCDLWQRIDQAMRFHQIELSKWRFDPEHRLCGPIKQHRGRKSSGTISRLANWATPHWRKAVASCRAAMVAWRRWTGTEPQPVPCSRFG